MLGAVLTAILTPFGDDDSVDLDAFPCLRPLVSRSTVTVVVAAWLSW